MIQRINDGNLTTVSAAFLSRVRDRVGRSFVAEPSVSREDENTLRSIG